MSITTVAELKAALGVGSLYSDAVIQSVCDAGDDVLLPFLWTNTTPTVAHSNVGTVGTLYFNENVEDVFYVGQSVVITKSGSRFNGTKSITSVTKNSITVTTNHTSDNAYHPINPYGQVAADTYVDYTTIPAIQEASLMVCVSIWTARQTNSGNGMNPDGSIGSMYSMSSQLVARVRGLLAPYLDPRSMVG
jgi:hypothetical protein